MHTALADNHSTLESHMNRTVITSHLSTVNTILAALAANVGHAIEAEATLAGKADLAAQLQRDIGAAGDSLAVSIAAAGARAAAALQAATEEINAAAVAHVRSLLSSGALSIESLGGVMAPAAPAGAALSAVPAAPAAPAAKRQRHYVGKESNFTKPVKYRDPATGNGWTGLGPRPAWLKELCVNGKTLADFLVVSEAAASPAPAPAPAPTPAPDTAKSVEEGAQARPEVAEFMADATVAEFNVPDIDIDLTRASANDSLDIGEVIVGIAAMGPMDAMQFSSVRQLMVA